MSYPESLEVSRLTDADVDRITARVAEVVAEWVRSGHRKATPLTHETACRVGYHAIGCTALDLRDTELAHVSDIVGREWAKALSVR